MAILSPVSIFTFTSSAFSSSIIPFESGLGGSANGSNPTSCRLFSPLPPDLATARILYPSWDNSCIFLFALARFSSSISRHMDIITCGAPLTALNCPPSCSIIASVLLIAGSKGVNEVCLYGLRVHTNCIGIFNHREVYNIFAFLFGCQTHYQGYILFPKPGKGYGINDRELILRYCTCLIYAEYVHRSRIFN